MTTIAKLSWFISWGVLIVWTLPAMARAESRPVLLEDIKGKYPLGLRLDILEDKEGNRTLQDIMERSSQFKSGETPVPNFGFTSSAYWARFSITGTVHLLVNNY